MFIVLFSNPLDSSLIDWGAAHNFIPSIWPLELVVKCAPLKVTLVLAIILPVSAFLKVKLRIVCFGASITVWLIVSPALASMFIVVLSNPLDSSLIDWGVAHNFIPSIWPFELVVKCAPLKVTLVLAIILLVSIFLKVKLRIVCFGAIVTVLLIFSPALASILTIVVANLFALTDKVLLKAQKGRPVICPLAFVVKVIPLTSTLLLAIILPVSAFLTVKFKLAEFAAIVIVVCPVSPTIDLNLSAVFAK